VSFDAAGLLDLEPRLTLADGAVFGPADGAPDHDPELVPLLTVAWRDEAPGATAEAEIEQALAEAGSVLLDREPVELAGVPAVRSLILHRGPGGRPTAAEQWRLVAGGRRWTVSALTALADQPEWGPRLAAAAAALRLA
jgi:hypothetical protein